MTLPHRLPAQKHNSIIDADSYKVPAWQLYRPGIKRVYSYLESRGGKNDTIMFAGLQPFLYEHLGQPVQNWEIEEAAEFFAAHFGYREYFNRAMWDRIVNKHDRMLPLKVRALPEGLIVPKRTPVLTIENTDDSTDEVMAALTSYKETTLMRNIWPACSIATRVFRMKQRIKPFFDNYSDNPISPFAVLDFSSRGVFGDDHGKMAGAVFCFMFQGSDNMPGIRHAKYYYDHPMPAFSVLASEHSIASGFGEGNDDDYIDHVLDRAPAGAIVSMVGDTWDIYKFSKKLSREDHKQKITNKKLNLVDRPDSCLDGRRKETLEEILRILADGFGTTKNSKGRDVINMNVKALWADGMNEHTVTEPFEAAEAIKFAPDSVFTGSGGGIAAADLDRDSDAWALKASEYLMADGERINVFKKPITDPGKNSKSGRFAVVDCCREHDVLTMNRRDDEEIEGDLLGVRFLNGDVIEPTNLDAIRARVDAQLA